MWVQAQFASVGFQLELSGFGRIDQFHSWVPPWVSHWLCPKLPWVGADGFLPGMGELKVCVGKNPHDPSGFFPFHLTALPVEKQTVCGQGRFEERKLPLRWRQN